MFHINTILVFGNKNDKIYLCSRLVTLTVCWENKLMTL